MAIDSATRNAPLMLDELDRSLANDGWGAILSKSNVAELLNCCTRTIERHVARGLLVPLANPATRGHVRFARRSVARFLLGEYGGVPSVEKRRSVRAGRTQ